MKTAEGLVTQQEILRFMSSGFATLFTRLRARISNTRILNNLIWNAAGTFVPVLAAVISIPPLVEHMGAARFGILSLAWVVVGYFSFFDLGLSRAMTQLISQRIGAGAEGDVPAIAQTGVVLMLGLGLIGGALIAALSPWLVQQKLSIPPDLLDETLVSFFLLAGSIPVVILTSGLRGILEARQRFDIVNIVRAPLGALTYFGPLMVLPFSNHLPPVVTTLVLGRLVSLLAYLVITLRLYPELARRVSVCKSLLPEMLSFGGWMTVSNIAGPILLYAGRVALAVLVSAEAVAYFSTPYDMVISVLLIPGIFIGVLFPVFSEWFCSRPAEVGLMYKRSMLQNLAIVLPICVITYVFAQPSISIWINPEFSAQSFRVAQWLAVGVFINSFGYYGQALVQAYGRPDLTAKLHLAELVAYLPYMIILVDNHGVEGAAVSWVIRVAISTIVLFFMANACLSGRIKTHRRIN